MVSTLPRDRRRRGLGFSDRLSTGLLHPSLAFRCRRRSAARYRLVVFCHRSFFSRRKLAVNHRRGRTIRRRLSRSSDCSLCSGSTTHRRWLDAATRPASWISPPMRPIRLSDNTAGYAWGERLKQSGISSSRRRPSICHWRGATNTI